MVSLCNGDANTTVPEAGFQILLTKNYDKSSDDPSHTCAYVLGKGYTGTGASRKTVYIIVIRGTSGAEWYANFDVLPERNYDSPFAENFLLAAQDVFDGTNGILASDPDALLIITGHSRGASTSNLLGMLYNKVREPANTFVYTSATPRTVRTEIDKAELGIIDSNIFNTVNEGDVVTFLPLEGWGFVRLGTDYSGSLGDSYEKLADDFSAALIQIAPDIEAYYTARHSLTGPGLSDNGVTAYELMQDVIETLINLDVSSIFFGLEVPESIAAISETSDYYPLRVQFEKLMGNGGVNAIMMLSQHMQQAYSMLLS